MRLFIAMPVAEPAASRVTSMLTRFRAKPWPVRWIGDHAVHITMKFLGGVPPERLDGIVRLLDEVAGPTAPLPLFLGGVTAFPEWSRPRVLVLAVTGSPALAALHRRVEAGAEQLGFAPEDRPFRPHVTLGRVRDGGKMPPGWRQAFEAVAASGPAPESFVADRVMLIESQLGPSGSRYTIRHDVRFH